MKKSNKHPEQKEEDEKKQRSSSKEQLKIAYKQRGKLDTNRRHESSMCVYTLNWLAQLPLQLIIFAESGNAKPSHFTPPEKTVQKHKIETKTCQHISSNI